MKYFDDYNFEAAIFDLDGTLIDSMKIWRRVLPDFLANYGIEASPDILSKVSFMTINQSSAYVSEQFPELLLTGEQIKEIWMKKVYEEYTENVKLKPGAFEFLKELKKRGIKVAVATACNEKLAEPCLINNQIMDMIDCITYAEEVGCGKESPGVYLECLRRIGCTPDKALLFEDILVAVKTADSIGLKTVAIEEATAESDRDEIKKTAFGYIVDFTEMF